MRIKSNVKLVSIITGPDNYKARDLIKRLFWDTYHTYNAPVI